MALLFVGIYIGMMNFASFVLLQIIWGQDRLIMIYYPLIFLFLLGGLCYLFQSKPLRKFFFIYPMLLFVVCGGTLIISKNRVARNTPVLQQNMLGETRAPGARRRAGSRRTGSRCVDSGAGARPTKSRARPAVQPGLTKKHTRPKIGTLTQANT